MRWCREHWLTIARWVLMFLIGAMTEGRWLVIALVVIYGVVAYDEGWRDMQKRALEIIDRTLKR